MSATDELRRLLDERGVEHYDGVEKTYWLNDRRAYRASADEVSNGLIQLHLWCTTPEQAIEATLGRGTCRFIDDSDGEFPPKCSACGYEPSIYECSWLNDGGYEFEGNYCPNCGAKVVS